MADGTEPKQKRTTGYEVINFRLDAIDKSLADLKDVVLETKMQERDIKSLAEKLTEVLQAINSHDSRIKALEIAPTQNKAEKWQYITDYLFKALVAGGIIYFLSKIGFPIGG